MGDTPLHAASWKGHKECVEKLLAKNANVWVRNQDKKTPYDVAKASINESAQNVAPLQDVDVAALINQVMKSDTTNEQSAQDYLSDSDED